MCQGRDHIVNIQSGRHNLVIVNVHFEPELTLRQLRGRLHLIHPHWPSYPNKVDIILDDFNICDPEEGRIHVWNQTFTDGDPTKTAMFHSFFHMSLRLPNLITREETPQPLGSYTLFQRFIAFFLKKILWLRHEIFTAIPMSSRTWESEPFRVITQQYASSFKSPQIEDTRANVFPAGRPNIPFSVTCCSFTMTTVFLLIRLVRSQSLKLFLTRLRSRRVVGSHGRHPTVSVRSS